MKYSKLAAAMLMAVGAFFCIAPQGQAMEVFSLPGQALNDNLTHVYYRGGVRHGGGYRHGYRGGGYRYGYRGGYRYGYRGGVYRGGYYSGGCRWVWVNGVSVRRCY